MEFSSPCSVGAAGIDLEQQTVVVERIVNTIVGIVAVVGLAACCSSCSEVTVG